MCLSRGSDCLISRYHEFWVRFFLRVEMLCSQKSGNYNGCALSPLRFLAECPEGSQIRDIFLGGILRTYFLGFIELWILPRTVYFCMRRSSNDWLWRLLLKWHNCMVGPSTHSLALKWSNSEPKLRLHLLSQPPNSGCVSP